jgi:Ser-tRNA(Ala) deacylase AlaX
VSTYLVDEPDSFSHNAVERGGLTHTGGGQPSDMGNLILSGPNGGKQSFRVEMCIRKKLESIHLVRVPATGEAIWEDVSMRVEGGEGADVVVEVEVDWDRRTDQVRGTF